MNSSHTEYLNLDGHWRLDAHNAWFNSKEDILAALSKLKIPQESVNIVQFSGFSVGPLYHLNGKWVCSRPENPLPKFNLKLLLMNLGNKLVTERGFDPAVSAASGFSLPRTDTLAIKCFTDWLNHCTAAQEVLAELGVEWPVTPQQRAQANLNS